ncbi:MAG: hypothetical protein HC827_11205, partial [Cyanobacteria bacterium RM1_2_2]|nr:hypothetical protein [Cyanobacteria bacterium RM1_2_2]
LAQNQPEPSPPSSPSPDTPLTEAQGWQVAADGSITLVAMAPKISTDQLSNQRLQCQ